MKGAARFAVVLLSGCQSVCDISTDPRLADLVGSEASVVDAGNGDAIEEPPIDAFDADLCGDASPCILAEGQPGAQFLAVIGDVLLFTVYAPNGSSTELWSIPRTGGTPKQIDTSLKADDLAIDGDHLVALEDHKIVRMRADGSDRRTLATSTYQYNAVTVGEGSIVWSTRFYGIERIVDAGAPTLVVRTDAGGTTIAAGPTGIIYGDRINQSAILFGTTYDGTDSGVFYDFGSDISPVFQKGGGLFAGDVLFISAQQSNVGIYRWENGTRKDTFAPMATPGRLAWRAPYLYATDYGDFGKQLPGGLWRYDPVKDAWTRFAKINYPRGLAVDDDWVYVVESVAPAQDFHHRILRFPR